MKKEEKKGENVKKEKMSECAFLRVHACVRVREGEGGERERA